MNVIRKNDVEVVYIFGFITGKSKIKNFQVYMEDICFDEEKINEITTRYKIKKC